MVGELRVDRPERANSPSPQPSPPRRGRAKSGMTDDERKGYPAAHEQEYSLSCGDYAGGPIASDAIGVKIFREKLDAGFWMLDSGCAAARKGGGEAGDRGIEDDDGMTNAQPPAHS